MRPLIYFEAIRRSSATEALSLSLEAVMMKFLHGFLWLVDNKILLCRGGIEVGGSEGLQNLVVATQLLSHAVPFGRRFPQKERNFPPSGSSSLISDFRPTNERSPSSITLLEHEHTHRERERQVTRKSFCC